MFVEMVGLGRVSRWLTSTTLANSLGLRSALGPVVNSLTCNTIITVDCRDDCKAEHFHECDNNLVISQFHYGYRSSLYHDYSLLGLLCSPSLTLPHLLKALQQLLQLCIGIFWILDLVSDGPVIAVDLPIITARVCLVTEEVNLVVHDATPVLLLRKVVQAERLVPTSGENVKGDLSTNGVCETVVGERFLELLDHGGADVVLDVELLVVVALFNRGVTADGRDIDHAVAELDEGTALDGNVQVGDVVKNPVRKSALVVAIVLFSRAT
jgi:hypothetical protein